MKKHERQQKLLATIDENPFITDEDLAKKFDVSIQTIRLDRMELGIKELRERMKSMATKTYDDVRSLQLTEVIGDVIELQLDSYGISILEIEEHQIFKKTGIARGHFIFAQANSLAVALINQEIALTAKADIRFIRPVYVRERLVAKAKVIEKNGDHSNIEVHTYVNQELVFMGTFKIYHSNEINEERGVDE